MPKERNFSFLQDMDYGRPCIVKMHGETAEVPVVQLVKGSLLDLAYQFDKRVRDMIAEYDGNAELLYYDPVVVLPLGDGFPQAYRLMRDAKYIIKAGKDICEEIAHKIADSYKELVHIFQFEKLEKTLTSSWLKTDIGGELSDRSVKWRLLDDDLEDGEDAVVKLSKKPAFSAKPKTLSDIKEDCERWIEIIEKDSQLLGDEKMAEMAARAKKLLPPMLKDMEAEYGKGYVFSYRVSSGASYRITFYADGRRRQESVGRVTVFGGDMERIRLMEGESRKKRTNTAPPAKYQPYTLLSRKGILCERKQPDE